MITIGIDPHKSSITASAVNHDGTELGHIRLPVNGGLVPQLLRFAADWTARRWAVEGATGLGLGVAQGLAAAGETVVDVPATLAARARLLATGHGRKSDALDAKSVAALAQRAPLRVVAAEDDTVPLQLRPEPLRRVFSARCAFSVHDVCQRYGLNPSCVRTPTESKTIWMWVVGDRLTRRNRS